MRRVQLFLASSERLIPDRDQLRSWVSKWNTQFLDQDFAVDVFDSTNVSMALSTRRSQEGINDIIRTSDVFVLLFADEVGQYTREEFDVAATSFRAFGKPLIFTYRSMAERQADSSSGVESVHEFERALQGLDHYWASYDTSDSLALQLNTQLLMLNLVPRDFDNLTSLTLSVDARILGAVRDLQTADDPMRSGVYTVLLKGELADERTSLSSFFPRHLSASARDIARLLPDQVDLTIDVDSKLNVLNYRAADFDIEVARPPLTWNCHCGALAGLSYLDSETADAKRRSCPIHGNERGDDLEVLYRTGVLRTTFDDVEVLWQRSPEVWPPTIDTFVMCNNLARAGVLGADHRTVLDLGCGTGFLGLYLAIKNPAVRHLYLADWLMTPLLFSMISWENILGLRDGLSMTPLLGLNTAWVESGELPPRVDLCVCNPPYVPSSPRFPEIQLAHTVGGTELLEHAIERAADIARETYVNFSDIALSEAEAAAERRGKVLVEVGEGRLVPFTVPQAVKHRGYVEELVDQGRLVRDETSPYEWLHRIRTYRIDEGR